MVMNPDGSEQALITTVSSTFRKPVLSHSGNAILFIHLNDDYSYELYRINMDGSNLTLLDSNPRTIGSPDWSPDDDKILYTRRQLLNTQAYELILLDLTSGQTTTIASSEDYVSGQFTPENRILYRDNTGKNDLYITNADGIGAKHLLNNVSDPTFSPDGNQIAYVAMVEPNNPQIFISELNGKPSKQITFDYTISWDSGFPNFGNYDPQWSPDGKSIVYTSEIHKGLPEIYVMPVNGAFHRRLTDTDRRNEYPVFSNDGQSILFSSGRDLGYNAEIYTMQADGSDQRPLTLFEGSDVLPVMVKQ